MTEGQRLVASVHLKTTFYDRYEERNYRRFVEIARRIVDEPNAIAVAASYLAKHVANDPHLHAAYEVWKEALSLRPTEIARRLLEDSENGAYLRGTAPVFVVLDQEQSSLSLPP
jgi:hypothetical protein